MLKKIILTYKADLPDNQISWNKELEQLRGSSERIIKEGSINIPVEVFINSDDLPILKDGDLLITAVYSYAQRKYFSIPLDSDQVVAWLELSRGQENLNKITNENIRKTQPKFYSVDGLSNIGSLTMSGMLAKSVSYSSCDVIKFSSDVACQPYPNSKKITFYPIKEKCVPYIETEEDKELKKLLPQSWR